jgi:nucleoside recognition membrane protein YjiH
MELNRIKLMERLCLSVVMPTKIIFSSTWNDIHMTGMQLLLEYDEILIFYHIFFFQICPEVMMDSEYSD